MGQRRELAARGSFVILGVAVYVGVLPFFPHADLPRRASFLVQKMWVCQCAMSGRAECPSEC